ncbi:tat (twin-arginine translocation) pathway signal sequence [Streptomyces sp. SID13726]|uniref:tat (twin-arginine translocation) pathway signal sequence n=1 Tax=Streptomyces sp. SID13726 TaxID=2706058 RepID=UPI0013B6C75B|nr:tat (twin-arginine translocation) pathway signal sequence [Streptomyces sp. SID13726]NEB00314.1 tat (twin-arginine translocation) pathway signal sequence [Streptomyces sp. SID13726]
MSSLAPPSRPAAALRRQLGLLTALAGAGLVAFFLAPNALARTSVSTANVGESFRGGFVAYWRSGGGELPAGLESTVDFWFRFHVVKAVVSALLLAVACALAVVLRRYGRQRTALREGGRSGRVPIPVYGTLVGVFGLFALVALMANVQGAAAPFASLLPMLTGGGPDGELGSTLTEIRRQLAGDHTGPRSPALTAMIGDFAVYHAVLAVLAALVALALTGASVVLWRRAARSGAVVSGLLAAVVLVVTVANSLSAADSSRALAGFFAGGW